MILTARNNTAREPLVPVPKSISCMRPQLMRNLHGRNSSDNSLSPERLCSDRPPRTNTTMLCDTPGLFSTLHINISNSMPRLCWLPAETCLYPKSVSVFRDYVTYGRSGERNIRLGGVRSFQSGTDEEPRRASPARHNHTALFIHSRSPSGRDQRCSRTIQSQDNINEVKECTTLPTRIQ